MREKKNEFVDFPIPFCSPERMVTSRYEVVSLIRNYVCASLGAYMYIPWGTTKKKAQVEQSTLLAEERRDVIHFCRGAAPTCCIRAMQSIFRVSAYISCMFTIRVTAVSKVSWVLRFVTLID